MSIPRVFCRLRLLVKSDFSLVNKRYQIRNSVLSNRNLQIINLVKQFRTQVVGGYCCDNKVKNEKYKELECKSPSSSSSSSSCSSSDESDSDDENDNVCVEYHRGLPQVTVPLPSRRERCVFTLKPISNSVGDFLEMLKEEDKGIDVAACRTNDGIRIASSNTIETLLQEDFRLIINDRCYNVNCPKQERLTGEEVKGLANVKNMVHQLYEVLNVDEHNCQKENEIMLEIENVKKELLPLEEQIRDLEFVAEQRGNWLAWAGLGFMSVQFGILARLTWWEYSWDIMEPVTYFVTYGTAMAMYSYYVLTKEEYILPSVTDRQKLLIIHQKAKKLGLDLQKYNQLQDQLVKLNKKLNKLRNPLKVTPKQRQSANSNSESSTLANIAKTLSKCEQQSEEACRSK